MYINETTHLSKTTCLAHTACLAQAPMSKLRKLATTTFLINLSKNLTSKQLLLR